MTRANDWRSCFWGVVLILAAGTGTVHAQEDEVRAVLDQVFEGMKTANADQVRAVFAPGARFMVIDTKDGPARITSRSPDGWLNAMSESQGKWDEQVYDVVIQVDENMASAWAPYTFYLDGNISHCGINSIELLKDAGGWKVTQFSDTRRREGCPDPLGD